MEISNGLGFWTPVAGAAGVDVHAPTRVHFTVRDLRDCWHDGQYDAPNAAAAAAWITDMVKAYGDLFVAMPITTVQL